MNRLDDQCYIDMKNTEHMCPVNNTHRVEQFTAKVQGDIVPVNYEQQAKDIILNIGTNFGRIDSIPDKNKSCQIL
jgi:hypothetical protein